MEICLDLSGYIFWDCLIVVESHQQDEPVVQVSRLINNAHIRFIITNNLNEVAHNETEKGYTTKHDDYCEDSLHVADWEVISIANCAQCCQSIITTNSKLVYFVPIR